MSILLLHTKYYRILSVFIVLSLVNVETSVAQRSSRGLSQAERTQVINAIVSGNESRMLGIASSNPGAASAIAALYAKHSGAKGRSAGEIAKKFVNAAGAGSAEAGSIVAAVARKTASSLSDTVEIMMSVANGGPSIFRTQDGFVSLVGEVAKRINLRGESAGSFAATVAKKRNATPIEAGRILGSISKAIGAGGVETKKITGSALASLGWSGDQARAFAGSISAETGINVMSEEALKMVGRKVVEKKRVTPEERLFNDAFFERFSKQIGSTLERENMQARSPGSAIFLPKGSSAQSSLFKPLSININGKIIDISPGSGARRDFGNALGIPNFVSLGPGERATALFNTFTDFGFIPEVTVNNITPKDFYDSTKSDSDPDFEDLTDQEKIDIENELDGLTDADKEVVVVFVEGRIKGGLLSMVDNLIQSISDPGAPLGDPGN